MNNKRKKLKNKKSLSNVILHKILVIIAVAVLIVLLDIGCMIKNITGFPCPGCGTTRACLSFISGKWLEAFYWQPLFWLTVPLLIFFVAKADNTCKNSRYITIMSILLLVIYLGVYLLRMYLLFPNTPPMDYNYDAPLYHVFIKIKSLIN